MIKIIKQVKKSRIHWYVLIVLLVVVTACQGKENASPQPTLPRSDSLLYAGTKEYTQHVIVQLDPWSQTSRLWIETQQNVCCSSRSPDNSRVAYFVREQLEICSLWVADFDAQNASQIGGPYPCGISVDIEWSFDGQYVGFRTGPDVDTVKLYVLDAATGYEIITVPGVDFDWSKMTNQLVVYEGQSAYWTLDKFFTRYPDAKMPIIANKAVIFATNCTNFTNFSC